MSLRRPPKARASLVAACALAAAVAAVAAGAAPPASAPALVSFPGLGSAQLPGVNPADVQVAAGPAAVVQTVNASVGVWTREGQPLRSQTLASFFSVGGVDRSRDAMTDPRVVWDPLSGRFLAAVFDITRLELVVAISTSADPLGPWSVVSLPSSGCPDQPRLGASDTLVVVTDDLFSSCRGRGRFLGGEVTVLSKQDMLAGVASPRRSHFGPDARFAAITPAVSLTPAPTMYLTAVSESGRSLQVVSLDASTVSSLPFEEVPLARPLDGAEDVAQRGTTQPLDAGDERIQNAVFDSGELWAVASEGCSGGRACARVVGVDPARSRLLHEWSVSLPGGRSMVYPAVAPDGRGNLVLAFGYTAPGDFPGLGYTYVRPDGAVAAPADLLPGSAANESGRFGDYSGAARDPSDPSIVWVGAQIGQATDGTTLGWGSAIAAVRVPPQAPAVASTTAARAGPGVAVAAQVYPEGAATTVRVEYGLTTAYGQRTAPLGVAAGARSQTVTTTLGRLLPGRTYHVRAVATSANGTSTGPDVVLRTAAAAPAVAYPAPAVTARRGAAVLRALVDGGGAPATVVFEYGPTRGYGARTPARRVAGGARRALVTAAVRLEPGAVYHFRAVARNAAGSTAGADRVVRAR